MKTIHTSTALMETIEWWYSQNDPTLRWPEHMLRAVIAAATTIHSPTDRVVVIAAKALAMLSDMDRLALEEKYNLPHVLQRADPEAPWPEPLVFEDAAPDAADLERYREYAKSMTWAKIRGARLLYITDLPGQDTIYQAKEREAARYVAEDPAPADLGAYPWMSREVGDTAPTPHELAQLWLNMAAIWEDVGSQIEGLRTRANKAVAAAVDQAGINAALADLEAGLAAVAPQF